MDPLRTVKVRHRITILAVAVVLVVVCAVVLPLIGSAPVDFGRALAGESPDAEIIFYARLPRVLLALVVGGALFVDAQVARAVVAGFTGTPAGTGDRKLTLDFPGHQLHPWFCSRGSGVRPRMRDRTNG